ncbi:MAG: Holliday junction branch migration DNA helicase RuvB [Acidimicrobiia bacterium]|nr:Holliday junction branch migration DNA helicase RuvB [Acidimicrobiia bacterium]MDH4306343.1 Holliday junction branch migration DNA helicase RuvB [Acidimicrobiia bacterium]MDH5292520.1 Holliday junction branch migration DNA helicase RuvB [Acidimicrobiia bacterium]
MRDENVLAGDFQPFEDDFEATLRPQKLDEFVGQEKVKERLRISIEASRTLGKPLDHVLLSGPPGLGKTSLAGILANELGASIKKTSGPALERPGDLAAILSNLESGDVFFIDEIHRVPRAVEEVMYPAMEDFELDIILGKGPAATSIRLDLARFTLVGATTRIGTVAAPLRDRFGIVERIDYYTPADLDLVVRRSSRILGIEIDDSGASQIAERSRGTARIANRLLARVRDYAIARADGRIDGAVADAALDVFEIDDLGLDKVDRAILDAVVSKFGGGPVGLGTLAIAVGEEPETVEDAYEPFLLQAGLLARTPRGRVATLGAYRHLGLEPPASAQTALEL